MTEAHDPFDPENLRLTSIPVVPATVPTKIRKRHKCFIKTPMLWVEKLGEAPLATGATHHLALHLLHLHWKNRYKPFKLPNGMLRYDGLSRQSKWRALNDLERRGLISVERRPSKSPVIHVLLADQSVSSLE
jgi:hypothetical protein